MEDRKCEKCNTITYCQDHHKYPKHAFKMSGKSKNPILVLCYRCHTFLHNFIGWIFTRKGHEKPLSYYDEKTDEFMNS